MIASDAGKITGSKRDVAVPTAWDKRHSMLAALITAVTLVAPNGVGAQGLSDLTAMVSLTGACERLVAAGKNFSDDCNGMILQSIYKTGRTGFSVTIGDKGVAMTFSGMEGAKPDADSQLQSLDKVILNLNIDGVEPTSTEVTGGCAYSNPYLGPMTISCQATGPKGEAYLLQFRTDGSEPKLSDLSGKQPPEAASDTREFSVQGWTGGPLKDDADGGCLMSKDVNRKISLMVYANANEAFDLNLYNEDWNFELGQKIDADLLFDGTTFPLDAIEVRNPNVLTLFGGAEEEGLQGPFQASSELVFRMGREQITVDLGGSGVATEALWSCVGGE